MGAYDCDCINNLEYDRRERKQKEQPQSTVSTTQSTVRSTDLIDRGQVIDVIEDYPHGNVWNVESMEEMVDKIKTLPTVQPVATDTNVGDTISRQAAIDALDCINGTEEVLRSLPSAQPEYEPADVEDFAKTMSENTLYNFMAWNNVAFTLMNEMGFVICKKTM